MPEVGFDLPVNPAAARAVAAAFAVALSHALQRLGNPDVREVLEATARDMQAFRPIDRVPAAMDALGDFIAAARGERPEEWLA